MNKKIRSASLFVFLIVSSTSFAQMGNIDKENQDLKDRQKQIDKDLNKNEQEIAAMDSIAEQLENQGNSLEKQLSEAEQQIEAAQEELNKDMERAEWAKYMKFGILALALLGVVFIFMKRRKK